MFLALTRFVKYTAIGTTTFAADLLLLFALIDIFGMNATLAAGGAFAFVITVNYLLSRRFVFLGTHRAFGSGYAIFFLIAAGGLLIVTGGMFILTEILSVHFLVARVAVALVTGFWNYLMNLYLNFQVAGKHYHSDAPIEQGG